jgi:hypothetical protein
MVTITPEILRLASLVGVLKEYDEAKDRANVDKGHARKVQGFDCGSVMCPLAYVIPTAEGVRALVSANLI